LNEGERSDSIFQIGNGICRVEKTNDKNQRVVITTMGSTEMFGEISFLGKIYSSCSIE
jgi:CRP-like cAMP-binding protein